MTTIFSGTGLGGEKVLGGSLGYGPKLSSSLGGGLSVGVNASNGNVWLKQDKGFLSGLGGELGVCQSYNSEGVGVSHWRFSIETSLSFEGTLGDKGSLIRRRDGDGHESVLGWHEGHGRYEALDGSLAFIEYQGGVLSYKEGSGDWVYEYNELGELCYRRDRLGHVLTVIHEGGQLVGIREASGRQEIRWVFRGGLLSEVCFESDGERVSLVEYEYDERGRLRGVSQDLGEGKRWWTSYEYLGDTELIRHLAQADGTSLTLTYDALGRVVSMRDGSGQESRYEYLEGKTRVCNGLGEIWTYAYDEQARWIGIEGPLGYRVSYAYEGQHLVGISQEGERWRFEWNDRGDCIRTESPTGEVVVREFDDEHRLLSETRYECFDGKASLSYPVTERYVYDERGLLRFVVGALGLVTEYRYNQDGLALSRRSYTEVSLMLETVSLSTLISWVDAQDASRVELETYAYDWRGNRVSECHYREVDALGMGIERPDNLMTYRRYDARGQLLEQYSLTADGVASTTYAYDGLGRLQQTMSNGRLISRIEYDDAHQRIITSDAAGLQTIDTYDLGGLLLSRQRLLGEADYGCVRFEYDEAGRLRLETDVDGRESYLFYDHEGQLIGKIGFAGEVVEYTWDSHHRLIKTCWYEASVDLKQLTGERFLWEAIKPSSSSHDRVKQSWYNDKGQLAAETDAMGGVVLYRYDAHNRLIEQIGLAKPLGFLGFERSDDDRVVSYYYDALGRLQAKINGEGASVSWRYDAMGRVVESVEYATRHEGIRSGDWAHDKPLANAARDSHHDTIYNALGLKVAECDAEGYVTEYRYDGQGLLVEEIAYDTPIDRRLMIKEVTLEALRPEAHTNDRHRSYQYNAFKQLICETNAFGLRVSYTYNEQGLLISKEAEDSQHQDTRATYYRYDALGRVIQSLDAIGVALLTRRQAFNAADSERIWQEHSTRSEYDKAGRLQATINALGQRTRYDYNEAGLLHYSLSANGALVEYRYNHFGQVVTKTAYSTRWLGAKMPTEAELALLADARFDESVSYEYNAIGLVVAERHGKAGETILRYNAFGELSAEETLGNGQERLLTTYTYDRRGLWRYRGVESKGVHQVSEQSFDAFGRLEQARDANGSTTRYWWNKRGEEVLIDSPEHQKTVMTYDAFGRLVRVKGKASEYYTYDDAHHTLSLTRMGTSAAITTEFNAFGDTIRITDANEQTRTYQYNARGQLIHSELPEGAHINYRYDALGRLIWEEVAGGQVTTYTFDADNHMLSKTLDPNGLSLTTSWAYDALGRQLRVTDAKDLSTLMTYDDEGRLIEIAQGAAGLSLINRFEYSVSGLLERQVTVNPGGYDKVVAYEWDALGRCTSRIDDPDGLRIRTQYEYDANGNLTRQIDAKHQITQYVYDSDNRLCYAIDARGVVTEHRYSMTGAEIETITYQQPIIVDRVDASLDLVSLIQPDNNDHHQFFAYDKQSRLLLSYDDLGFATEYTYDANNNIVAKKIYSLPCSLLLLKSGKRPQPIDNDNTRITHFTYDGLNRLRYRISPEGQVTGYTYDEAGRVLSERRMANLLPLSGMNSHLDEAIAKLSDSRDDQSTYYTYDALGRLAASASAMGEVTAWEYDALGHITSTCQYATRLERQAFTKKDWQDALVRSDTDRVTRFVYDGLGRECYRISAGGSVVERRYDALNNVLSERAYQKPVPLCEYTFDSLTSALSASLKGSDTHFTYDALGRLRQKTEALGQATSYEYDESNNLIRKQEANDAIWQYRYDAVNQLIETLSPVIEVTRYREGEWLRTRQSIKTLTEYDSFGNVVKCVQDADGLSLTTIYVFDGLNRKIATRYPESLVTDAHTGYQSRQVLSERWEYNAFGEAIAAFDKSGKACYQAYDSNGRLRWSVDAGGALTQYDYNAFDKVIKKTQYGERLPEGLSDYSADALYAACKPSQDDRHESYDYNSVNQVMAYYKDAITSYDSLTGHYYTAQPTTRFDYNAFGEVVLEVVSLSDTKEAITRYRYNQEGLKTASINAEGYVSTWAYDAKGLVIEETLYAKRLDEDFEHDTLPTASAKDRVMCFDYDAIGQLRRKTLKAASWQRLTGESRAYETLSGDLSSTYEYDSMGHLIKTTDAKGYSVYSVYNDLGQLITTLSAGEPGQVRGITTWCYDALGQLIESRQGALGGFINDQGEVKRVGDSDKDILTREVYDEQGHVVSHIDGNGHRLDYGYDANGNRVSRTQGVRQADGRILTEEIRYRYDKDNRLIQTATRKANGLMSTKDTAYNAFGEVVAEGINGVMSIQIDYDRIGRVWRSNRGGYYQLYLYDLANGLTQTISASVAYTAMHGDSGVDLSSAMYETASHFDEGAWCHDLHRQDTVYDALGRVLGQVTDLGRSDKAVAANEAPLRAKDFNELDAFGQLISHTSANGYRTEYEYNTLGALVRQTLPEVEVVDEHGVARRLSPVIIYAVDELGQTIATTDANGHRTTAVRDAEGRVVSDIDAKGHNRDKYYDALGQLSGSRDELGVSTTYTYDKNNRLLSITHGASVVSYEYDELGQVLQEKDALGAMTRYAY